MMLRSLLVLWQLSLLAAVLQQVLQWQLQWQLLLLLLLLLLQLPPLPPRCCRPPMVQTAMRDLAERLVQQLLLHRLPSVAVRPRTCPAVGSQPCCSQGGRPRAAAGVPTRRRACRFASPSALAPSLVARGRRSHWCDAKWLPARSQSAMRHA